MKISIQIPTYKQPKTLLRAVKSALNQDYPNIEVVVLDDSPLGEGFNLLSSIDDNRLKVYKNAQNIGRSGTYRKLLYELITGDFVVNLDGDDYFEDTTFLSRAADLLLNNNNTVFYQATIYALVNGEKAYQFKHDLIKKKDEYLVLKGKDYFVNFFKNNYFGHLATVYNVELARSVGFYEYKNLNSDAESLLKLALLGDVILENKCIGVWVIHENNESKKYLNKSYQMDVIASFNRLKLFSEKYIGLDSACAWERMAIRSLNVSLLHESAKENFQSFLLMNLLNFSYYLTIVKISIKKLFKRPI
jgi:glycosyltransferase involved in cell wall biosynthesis